jgi:hypothetical protein
MSDKTFEELESTKFGIKKEIKKNYSKWNNTKYQNSNKLHQRLIGEKPYLLKLNTKVHAGSYFFKIINRSCWAFAAG